MRRVRAIVVVVAVVFVLGLGLGLVLVLVLVFGFVASELGLGLGLEGAELVTCSAGRASFTSTAAAIAIPAIATSHRLLTRDSR